MFIAALFTVAKTWKLPKCPSRWMKKEDVVHSIQWNIIQSLSSVQSPSHVCLFVTAWNATCQASLSITNSWSLLKLMSIEWWCHPTISSSVVPFSSCLQSFPVSGYLPMSSLFTSGGQSIRASASASVLPMNIQGWFPLGLTSLMSLQSKGL